MSSSLAGIMDRAKSVTHCGGVICQAGKQPDTLYGQGPAYLLPVIGGKCQRRTLLHEFERRLRNEPG